MSNIIKALSKHIINFIYDIYCITIYIIDKYLEITLSKPNVNLPTWNELAKNEPRNSSSWKNQPPEGKRELFWELLQEKERPNLLPWNSIFLRSTNIGWRCCLFLWTIGLHQASGLAFAACLNCSLPFCQNICSDVSRRTCASSSMTSPQDFFHEIYHIHGTGRFSCMTGWYYLHVVDIFTYKYGCLLWDKSR